MASGEAIELEEKTQTIHKRWKRPPLRRKRNNPDRTHTLYNNFVNEYIWKRDGQMFEVIPRKKVNWINATPCDRLKEKVISMRVYHVYLRVPADGGGYELTCSWGSWFDLLAEKFVIYWMWLNLWNRGDETMMHVSRSKYEHFNGHSLISKSLKFIVFIWALT